MKRKVIIFSTLLILMISYITWIFYMSEPKYIDNIDNEKQYNIERYDIVTTQNIYGDVCIGMVIQIDSKSKNEKMATVRNFESPYSSDAVKIIHAKKFLEDSTKIGFTQDYRIIGSGTFYHKVNHFIGFNIMLTVTIIVIIISLIVAITLIGIIRQWLGNDNIFL